MEATSVPYFPIPLRAAANGQEWRFHDPLQGCERVANLSARALLERCDGYRTWAEVIAELAAAFALPREEIEDNAARVRDELTGAGLLWWRAQRMQWYSVPRPASVLWNITQRCNLRCRHCVVNAGTPLEDELRWEESRRLIDQLAAFGVGELVLTGGEPLCHPGWFDIAEYARQAGLSLQIATNGTALDERAARRIAGLKAHVQVSLDGATAEVHDGFRQVPGAFERAVEAIRRLRANGASVTLAAVVTPLNVAQVPALYDRAVKLGAQIFRILPFVPYGRGAGQVGLELSPEQMQEISAWLWPKRSTGPIEVAPLEFECLFGPPPREAVVPDTHIGCDGAIGYATITADGRVLPCNYFDGVEAENFREHEFAWIWQHSRFLNYFRSLSVADLDARCRMCAYLSACRGSCIAGNLAHAKMFQQNVRCWLGPSAGG